MNWHICDAWSNTYYLQKSQIFDFVSGHVKHLNICKEKHSFPNFASAVAKQHFHNLWVHPGNYNRKVVEFESSILQKKLTICCRNSMIDLKCRCSTINPHIQQFKNRDLRDCVDFPKVNSKHEDEVQKYSMHMASAFIPCPPLSC